MSGSRFGDQLAPLMIKQRYRDGAWGPIGIEEVGDLGWKPHVRGIHYGQAVFEGQKAHRGPEGVALFRPEDHLRRLNRSARRLSIPEIDVEQALEATVELVGRVADLCPEAPGSLYIRPHLIADECGLLAEPASSYLFTVLVSPVDAYLRRDRAVRVRTELEAARAFPGGTGDVKYAGNYAAVYEPKFRARAEGYDEILWLDAREHRYVEETSSMNVMIVKDGVLTTPPAGDTILSGITRDSLLRLAEDSGIEVREEATAVDEDWSGVSEVFTSGTAVGVMPIGEVVHRGEPLFKRDQAGPICQVLGEHYRKTITGRGARSKVWVKKCASERKFKS